MPWTSKGVAIFSIFFVQKNGITDLTQEYAKCVNNAKAAHVLRRK